MAVNTHAMTSTDNVYKVDAGSYKDLICRVQRNGEFAKATQTNSLPIELFWREIKKCTFILLFLVMWTYWNELNESDKQSEKYWSDF